MGYGNCKNLKQLTVGNEIIGQSQMLITGSTYQGIGAGNGARNTITHPQSQISGYATELLTAFVRKVMQLAHAFPLSSVFLTLTFCMCNCVWVVTEAHLGLKVSHR